MNMKSLKNYLEETLYAPVDMTKTYYGQKYNSRTIKVYHVPTGKIEGLNAICSLLEGMGSTEKIEKKVLDGTCYVKIYWNATVKWKVYQSNVMELINLMDRSDAIYNNVAPQETLDEKPVVPNSEPGEDKFESSLESMKVGVVNITPFGMGYAETEKELSILKEALRKIFRGAKKLFS